MKSSSFDKDMLFFEAIQNILIAYYLKVAYNDKKLSKIQRNQILKLIVKSYLNKVKYKKVKRDLKCLLIWERKSGLYLEFKILEIYDLAERYYVESNENSDLTKLYQSLNHIRKLFSVNVDAIEVDEIKDFNTVYVIESDIHESFNDKGSWNGNPIMLFVPNDNLNDVVHYLNRTHIKTERINKINNCSHESLFLFL